eukprot:scaffold364_cov111-Skeletonema_marinoi.AAC.3
MLTMRWPDEKTTTAMVHHCPGWMRPCNEDTDYCRLNQASLLHTECDGGTNHLCERRDYGRKREHSKLKVHR